MRDNTELYRPEQCNGCLLLEGENASPCCKFGCFLPRLGEFDGHTWAIGPLLRIAIARSCSEVRGGEPATPKRLLALRDCRSGPELQRGMATGLSACVKSAAGVAVLILRLAEVGVNAGDGEPTLGTFGAEGVLVPEPGMELRRRTAVFVLDALGVRAWFGEDLD